MRNKKIGSGKPNGVSKSPWYTELENESRMPKESKWAKDAQEKRNGTKEPTSNEMGQEKPIVA